MNSFLKFKLEIKEKSFISGFLIFGRVFLYMEFVTGFWFPKSVYGRLTDLSLAYVLSCKSVEFIAIYSVFG